MPWLLYRYVLMDMLKVVGLTAAVLVTVIAFGATIKPLATNLLLDAGQTLKYLTLAIVPMLQFALPFSAGFGATLSLHRLTTDNEIIAMSACGISYRRIIMPILALGLGLTLVMVVLTQWVIPQFWTLIQQTVAKDVTKLFEASIRRGEPFQMGNLQIYANDIIVKEQPAGADGPQSRMILPKMAAAELDDDGRIVTDVTANNAVVDVYRRDGRSYLTLMMTDTVAFKPNTGELASAPQLMPEKAILIPGSFRDTPKAMTQSELLALRADPDRYAQVAQAKLELAEAIRDAVARLGIDEQLETNGRMELLDRAGAESGRARTFVVHADRLRRGLFSCRDGRKVEVIQFDGGMAQRRFSAADVELIPATEGALGYAAFDIVIGPHEVTDMQQEGLANQRERIVITNLTVAGSSRDDLSQLPSDALLGKASEVKGGPEGVAHRAGRLRTEIASLRREIVSRLMGRYALSMTACLLLVLGALLAMRLRGSLPLTVYVLAFLPAILSLILIAAGEQFLRDGGMLGGIVMWSGNALMLIMGGLIYRQIVRN